MKPYRVRGSWVDWIIDRIDRSRAPIAAVYTLIFLVPPTLLTLTAFAAGRSLLPERFGYNLLTGFWTVFPLALIHHLDRLAARALRQFRPARDLSDEEVAVLQVRLTTMPALPAAVTGLLGVAFVVSFYFAAPELYEVIQASSLQFGVGLVTLCLNFALLGTLIYHTVRQLRLISQVFDRARRIDVFNLTPLYAFSALSARTTIAWALAITLSAVVFPQLTRNNIAVAVVILEAALLLAVFALPLLSAHRRILAAKEATLEEVGKSLRRALAELNRRTDPLLLEDMDALHKLVTALVVAREMLSKVPTWPWSPGTPVAVGSALLLPVALFVIERLLAGVLGL